MQPPKQTNTRYYTKTHKATKTKAHTHKTIQNIAFHTSSDIEAKINTYKNIHIKTHTQWQTYTHIHMYIHVYRHTDIYQYIYIHIYLYKETYLYLYIYI